MIPLTVEGSVHKLDLWNLVVQEKLQFREYQVQAPETHGFINGRQAVAAGERAAAAALVVDDPVLESSHIVIVERDLIQAQKALGTTFHDLAALSAVGNSRNVI